MIESNSSGYLYSVTKPIIPCAPIPSARGGHTTLFVDGKLITFGGHYYAGENKFEYVNEVWVLNVDSLSWTKVQCGGDVPAPRYGHSAHLIGSRMFVFGGRGPNGALYKDICYLDLQEWKWVKISPSSTTPSARFYHAAEIVGRKIVIHGGWDENEVLQDLWIFNTDLFSWMQPRTAGFGPTERYGHSLNLTPDGRLFVFGGCSIDKETAIPKYNNDIHVLDTETMVWVRPRVNGSTPTGRYGHSATMMDNGQIVVFGGWGSGGCQCRDVIKDPRAHSIHILDTQTMSWSVPLAVKGQPSVNIDDTGAAISKNGKKELKHLYNHGACRATNSSSICIFGGFDGRQSVMDFFVIGVDSKSDEN